VSITPLDGLAAFWGGVERRSGRRRLTAQRQNPNPSHYEGFGTPRVSIVLEAKSGAACRRVGHPPEGLVTRPHACVYLNRPSSPSRCRFPLRLKVLVLLCLQED
jgi:hypothetical protein